MIGVDWQNVCGAPDAPTRAQIEDWLARLFPELADATLVVRIVDPDESARLNREFRGRDAPTNVLSFPFEAPPGVPDRHLGDLVVCADVVRREAREQGKPLADHWAHMIVHGTLHLLGYDHVRPEDAAVMEPLEVRLLAALGVPDPYHL